MTYRLSHLRQRIMLATGCSLWQAEKMEHWFLNELTEVLSRGDTIQLHEFGTFTVVDKEVGGYDFKRHELMPVRRCTTVKFKPTGKLKANVAALLKNQS